MTVKSLGTYEFPSKSRQELYGDDQLVHVWWKSNRMFCSAATFRAPKAMTWADFRAAMVDPWAGSDPDFDPAAPYEWAIDGEAFTPEDGMTLEQLGIGHKHVVSLVG